MKSHPMIFQADSVRGILAGRKTQTRRIISRLKGFGHISEFQASDTKGYDWKFRCRRGLMHDIKQSELEKCLPYAIGDRIWGKEAFCKGIGSRPFWYKADFIKRYGAWEQDVQEGVFGALRNENGWESPLFMPRVVSRLDLLITGLLVEPLLDIDDADALAEGVEFSSVGGGNCPRENYCGVWEKLNGKKHPWASNPPVLTFEFLRVECQL